MTEYIATFYSHYGAVCFKKNCQSLGLEAVIMPVPRNLSSSCGTCVKFLLDSDIQEFVHSGIFDEDVDTVYLVENDEYTAVYENHIR